MFKQNACKNSNFFLQKIKKVMQLLTISSIAIYAVPNAQAACTPLNEHDKIPQIIEQNQCFELQGGNKITSSINVQGRLFVKAGRTAFLEPKVNIIVNNGGNFEVRGLLEMEQESQLSIDDLSSFTVSGQLLMYTGSVINTRGKARIRNIGRIMAQPRAFIDLNGDTTLHNGGVLSLVNAPLHLHHNSSFMNYGTIDTLHTSVISASDSTNFLNSGRITLSDKTNFTFNDHARLTNRRNLLINGRLSFLQAAILDNGSPLRILDDGYFYVSDSSQIVNHHTLEILGDSVLNLKARFLNEGTLVIKKQGNMKVVQKAVVINTGTLRNEGGVFAVEHKSNFVNENIVSGVESRLQQKPKSNVK